MKKLVVALTAMAAFTGSAFAADLPARYTKAPAPVIPVYNWTGFYIFGGGGGGLWAADQQCSRSRELAFRSPSISARVATAGSERSVSVTIGSSAASGWPAFLVMASSAASRAPCRIRSQG